MIASEDAKNPLQARKQPSSTRIWPCYIRLKEGDEMVESGEFAETQVQRPPDQFYSEITYISACWSLLSKGLRGGKSRRLREVSLLRWMIASEDAKNPLKARKQLSTTRIWLAISAYRKGIVWWNQGSLRRHKCNVRRNSIRVSPVYIGENPPFSPKAGEKGVGGL
ncbi:MAG: hypothetical protein CL920_00695 [Deltaproteobacteria bacterium]|nr:hypothetical protein [Deltaproteobacteria bacterium]